MLRSAASLVSCLVVSIGAAQFLPATGAIAVAAGGFLGNVAANLGTDFLKRLTRRGAETFSRSFIGLDENNHIAKGVRRAYLASLRAFLDQWRKTLPKPRWFKRLSPQDQLAVDFATTLGDWLDREARDAAIEAFASAVHSGAGASAAQGRALREAFETAFGAETADGEAIVRRAQQARALAERQAFDELLEGMRYREFGLPAPPGFEPAFRGEARGVDGWFGLFLRAIGEEFKKDEEFKKIWETTQLAGVAAMAVELCRKMLADSHKDAGLRRSSPNARRPPQPRARTSGSGPSGQGR